MPRQIDGMNLIRELSNLHYAVVADPECNRCHGAFISPGKFCQCCELRLMPDDYDLLEVIDQCKDN